MVKESEGKGERSLSPTPSIHISAGKERTGGNTTKVNTYKKDQEATSGIKAGGAEKRLGQGGWKQGGRNTRRSRGKEGGRYWATIPGKGKGRKEKELVKNLPREWHHVGKKTPREGKKVSSEKA